LNFNVLVFNRITLFIFLTATNNYSQNKKANSDYNLITKKADSLYNTKNYKESAMYYSKAFKLSLEALTDDKYRAACSWALAGYKDSAFINLKQIENHYSNYNFISTDKDLFSLHNEKKWIVFLEKIKSNYEALKLDFLTIQKNAISCNKLDSLDENLYLALKKFKCIYLGEIHGTKEPSEFLVGIAKIMALNGKKLLIGIEIPDEAMLAFKESKSNDSLQKTVFFKSNRMDGRNNYAWLELIKTCNKLNSSFCFFDASNEYNMYRNLISCYESDTNVVVLMISGNVHNVVPLYKNEKKIGYFLNEYFHDRLLTVNHLYGEGYMFNMTDEGLKKRYVSNKSSPFALATNYQNYFMFNMFKGRMNGYSAFLFTKNLTPSFPIKVKR
jgi:hypothetical protein